MNRHVFLEYKGAEGCIAEITISRPESLNALNQTVILQLDEALDRMERDGFARALIIRGEAHFAAGADIEAMVHFKPKEAIGFTFAPVYNRIETLEIPTIAAISGYALGGGLELALCCDFRIAGEDAAVGLPEINLGIMPGAGGTVRLPRLIGEARAKELIFLGKTLKAQEAKAYGIVSEVVEKEKLAEIALELAEKLSRKSGTALAAAKRMIQKDIDAYGYAAERMEWGLLFDTPDQREGMDAFLQKRKPQFNRSADRT